MQHPQFPHRLPWFAAAALALAMALSTNPAGAQEQWNNYCPLPSGSWDSYTVVIHGYVSQTTANASLNGGVDPFYAYDSSTAGITANYSSSTGNTTVTYTGTPLPPGYSNIPVPPNSAPHFGVTGSGATLTALSQGWGSTSTTSTSSCPAVGVKVYGPLPATPTKYEVLYLQYTQDTVPGGEWFEIPYTITSGLPSVSYTTGFASPSDPIDFTNAGYWLSPTQIPLDDLNFGDMTPGSSAFGDSWNQLTNPAPLTMPVPEGGSGWMYLLLGGAACCGALFDARRKGGLRSRVA
ncbi:MAG: hypothetical protein ACRD3N_03340 [Terracidiphilus sp.]